MDPPSRLPKLGALFGAAGVDPKLNAGEADGVEAAEELAASPNPSEPGAAAEEAAGCWATEGDELAGVPKLKPPKPAAEDAAG